MRLPWRPDRAASIRRDARGARALETSGAAAALDACRQSPERPEIAKAVENVINSHGYRVLREKRTKDAIEIVLERPGDENATWILKQFGAM